MSFLKRIYRKLFGKEETYEGYRAAIIKQIVEGGGTVGKNVDIYTSKIDMTNPYLISIGDNVTITNSTLLTHDASLTKKLGYTYASKVTIGNNVFIGYNSTVLAGSTIGDNVVIGAGSVVSGNIPSNSVAVGVPCRVIKPYDELVEKRSQMMKELPVYELDIEGLLENKEAQKELQEIGAGFML